MRRWSLIAIPLAVLLDLGICLSLGVSHRVTTANFDRIEKGMTRPQVDKLLPGSLGGEMTIWDGDVKTHFLLYWDKDPTGLIPTNIIRAYLDDNGKVTSKQFQPWTFAGWWGQLRYRLRL
jgi:hypothetical protein